MIRPNKNDLVEQLYSRYQVELPIPFPITVFSTF
jgi:hypothetical protein